ncbi:Gp15 family bacteriophage protein [Lacticaseibacillus daqingensis]|uniref:Gp15 family bacteriophage protein n=1 Tax=Lacticaseibacillus daqingensis TaxID=2486014 RepID=UPI000F796185|nr:Gp15 family bacteriophage protein [Lacticaseibacillus daqingensis]
MFKLYEQPPETVTIGEKNYQLDMTFDRVLIAMDALEDSQMLDADKLEVFLQLLIRDKLPPVNEWSEAFYRVQEVLDGATAKVMHYDLNGDVIERHSKEVPDFSFSFDAGYIYAAFRQTYGIDLLAERGKLHWFEFISLFNGLPDETRFNRIRAIRSVDLSKVKDRDQKAELREQKRKLALPDAPDEEGDSYGR